MKQQANFQNIVLYADDDPDDLELVQEAFARFSNQIEVVTLRNGRQVVAYLDELDENDFIPCLIILDINMPEMNGREVLKTLRETKAYAGIPVVLFTTSSLPQDESFARKFNAGFVTKPLEFTQMKQITEIFINHCNKDVQKNIRKIQ